MKTIFHLTLFFIFLIVFVSGIVEAKNEERVLLDEIPDEMKVSIIVQKGDTLWMIAKPYYDGKIDYREYIYRIRQLNNLKQGVIHPGQVIVIPLSR